jgi:hypothetical protein
VFSLLNQDNVLLHQGETKTKHSQVIEPDMALRQAYPEGERFREEFNREVYRPYNIDL